MPKDEIDPDDPMELVGMELEVEDDEEVASSIADEYARMGYSSAEVYALFTDPRFRLTHGIFRRRGADLIRQCVDRVFVRWSP